MTPALVFAVDDPKDRRRIATEILQSLPGWFGRPEANARYIDEAATLPLLAAHTRDGRAVGFVTLRQATPQAVEMHALGVRPDQHRRGIGRMLVERASAEAAGAGAIILTVKTLGPSHPDRKYAGTRAFFAAQGFIAVEEFPDLWGPDTPCLLMARPAAMPPADGRSG